MKTSRSNNPDAADSIAQAISRLIFDGAYAPGDRLKLVDLAARLGVSQMPIREALWKLEGAGLVTNLPNRGAVVRQIDSLHIANVYDVRNAIETMLIEKIVGSITSSQLGDVERAQRAYESAVLTRDTGTILAADMHFHATFNAIARNDEATGILERSFFLISSLRLRLGFNESRLVEVVDEHAGIVAAIRAGDAKLAIQACRVHTNGARQSMIAALEHR